MSLLKYTSKIDDIQITFTVKYENLTVYELIEYFLSEIEAKEHIELFNLLKQNHNGEITLEVNNRYSEIYVRTKNINLNGYQCENKNIKTDGYMCELITVKNTLAINFKIAKIPKLSILRKIRELFINNYIKNENLHKHFDKIGYKINIEINLGCCDNILIHYSYEYEKFTSTISFIEYKRYIKTDNLKDKDFEKIICKGCFYVREKFYGTNFNNFSEVLRKYYREKNCSSMFSIIRNTLKMKELYFIIMD